MSASLILKKTFFSFLLLSLFTNKSQAQPWVENIKSENPTFYEIVDAFNAYWENRPYEKGKGFKQFKRWEYYWETRLMPNGDFPQPDFILNEWLQYQKSNQQTEDRSSSVANWVSQGPTASPGGYIGMGRINCIAFHPTNPNIFWVGAPAGGLWKTTNGGQTWSTNTDNLPVIGVSDIVLDPVNPNIMYIATGDGDRGSLWSITGGFVGDSKSIGVLKSIDGGSTWQSTGLNWGILQAKLIRRLIINPTNPQILLAAATDGIWRTVDAGATWVKEQNGYFIDIEFKPNDPSRIYASTYTFGNDAAVYRSTDSGDNFLLVRTIPDSKRINIEVTPSNPNRVELLVANAQFGLQGLWRSSDAGTNFNQYYDGDCSINLLSSIYDGSSCGGQGYYDLAFTINPSNANEIWVGGINTWASIDNGLTFAPKTMWTGNSNLNPLSFPVVHADKHDFKFHPLQPNTLFDCNDGGLYKSTDGGATWTDLSNGLGISQIYRIGVSQNTANGVICGLQDNGTKEIIGNDWYEVRGGDGMESIIDYTDFNKQYTSYSFGKLYSTTDLWNNTTTISDNIPGTPQGAWVTPFVMHPTNPQTLFAGYDKVYKSTNQGANWTAISPTLSTTLNSIAIAPSNPNVIYAASFDTLHITTNGGISWSSVPLGIFGVKISYLTVNPSNAQKVYMTLGGFSAGSKVRYSQDGGLTWTNLSNGLPNVPTNCLVYETGSNDVLYVGTDVGVFYRNINSSAWTAYQTGLPNVPVTELEISYNNNKLWAATYGRGLWNSDLNATAVGINNNSSSQEFLTIYPNPNQGIFNIATNIEHYDINIYNALGELQYAESNINSTKKIFDLSALKNGVYFIKVVSENKSVIQKLAISAH